MCVCVGLSVSLSLSNPNLRQRRRSGALIAAPLHAVDVNNRKAVSEEAIEQLSESIVCIISYNESNFGVGRWKQQCSLFGVSNC